MSKDFVGAAHTGEDIATPIDLEFVQTLLSKMISKVVLSDLNVQIV